MATKVHMEALSPTMEEGQLVKWLKSEGDAISEGDVLAEIETDKATMELVARGSGVLRSVSLGEGETAAVGEVIAVIAGEGEDVPAAGAGGGAEAKAEEAESSESESEEAESSESESEAAESPSPDQPVETPAGAGEASAKRTATDAQAPAGKADAPATDAPAKDAPKQKESPSAGDGRVKASPLARRLAEEQGLSLSEIRGSGPGGRIVKADIESALEAGGAPAAAERPAAAAEAEASAPAMAPAPMAGRPEESESVEEVPISQMRKAIAKRLVTSIGPVPTFYLTIEVDATRLMEVRAEINRRLEKDGVKTSVNDFIVKAVATALARHPEVNAQWGDGVIYRHHRVHVGVAVAIEDGLITPIIRDADRKGVREISTQVRELAGRAREKKLKPEEYTGATFSVSNLGMFGIDEFTAIINPPEAGILAVGRIEEKVVAENGQPVVRPRMRVTMSCDHRVIDGAMGAQFLQTLRDFLEDPLMMLA